MKIAILLTLVFLLSACATNQTAFDSGKSEKETVNTLIRENESLARSLFYKRCISRNERKGYIDLEEKCSCMEEQFLKTEKSYLQQAEACSHLGIKPGDVIVEPIEHCESYQIKTPLTEGDVIVQYQVFDKNKFVPGVRTKDAGLIWSIVEMDSEGIILRLEKGEYYSKKVGDTTRFYNSGHYRKFYPQAPLWNQVNQTYRVCVGPKL